MSNALMWINDPCPFGLHSCYTICVMPTWSHAIHPIIIPGYVRLRASKAKLTTSPMLLPLRGFRALKDFEPDTVA
jgi:hypothetical protein